MSCIHSNSHKKVMQMRQAVAQQQWSSDGQEEHLQNLSPLHHIGSVRGSLRL
jgi:hypothetical protein